MMGLTWEGSRLCRFHHVAASWVHMCKSLRFHTPCIFWPFFLVRNVSSHLKSQKEKGRNIWIHCICADMFMCYTIKKLLFCRDIAKTQISFLVSIRHTTSLLVTLLDYEMPKSGGNIQTKYSCLDRNSTNNSIFWFYKCKASSRSLWHVCDNNIFFLD